MGQSNWVRLGLPLILVSALYLWVTPERQTIIPAPQSEVKEVPDYSIETFTSSVFNADGSLKYTIEANRLDHFPIRDITQLKAPFIKLYQPNKPTWYIRAETGYSTETDIIELSGDVNISGKTEGSHKPITMQTESLTLQFDRKYAETEDAVTIATNTDEIRSNGLQADFANDVLTFIAQVHAKHVYQ